MTTVKGYINRHIRFIPKSQDAPARRIYLPKANAPAYQVLKYMKNLKLKIMQFLIESSVPFLNLFRKRIEWPYTLDELGGFEENTLGRELYQLLKCRGLEYLPKYEMHDTYHALLGYGTTVMDELFLQAFMWGNRNSTFAGKVLFLIGFMVFPSQHILFKEEIMKGRLAKPLRRYDVRYFLKEDIHLLRSNLCIKY